MMQSNVGGNVKNCLITDHCEQMEFSALKIKTMPNQGRAQNPARRPTSGIFEETAALHFAQV